MGSSNPIDRNIINNVAISDFCSDSFDSCYNYVWSLQIVKDSADGNPLVTIEISNDGINWDAYHVCSTDYELIDNSVTFYNQIFPFKHFRVCVEANGTTTGTISADLFLKDA